MPITAKFRPKRRLNSARTSCWLITETVRRGSNLPIPVEEISRTHLRLTFEIDNPAERLGYPDVLGALWAADRLWRLTRSLEPTETLTGKAVPLHRRA